MAILKPVSERQVRMAGKMAITDSDTTFNCLKMLANLEIKRRDEFVRQRNDKLHQNAEAWRLETKIVEQLNEALVLIEDAIKRKNASLKEAISVLESERQARKVAETTKEDLKMSLNHLKDLLNKELTKKDELKRQRDEALHQREEALREKTNIAKQLAEPSSGNLKATAFELEYERQVRKRDEMAKVDLETLFNHLKMLAGKEIKKRDEFARKKTDALPQQTEALREKEKIPKQSAEVLRLVKGQLSGKTQGLIRLCWSLIWKGK
jgi:hypothetical protein